MTAPNGTDRRMVTYPATSGLADANMLPIRPRVAVVGGGIAGLTAATALAERGVEVTLYERAPYLGGRAGGWPSRLPDGTDVTMSRGFHAFFRQYYNLRALLRRTDPGLDRLSALDDYPLLDSHGRVDTFSGLPRTPPWNALIFAIHSPTFRWHDLLRLKLTPALPLLAVDVPGVYDRLDEIDAAAFLRRINFPAGARHLAFEVFSRSFFAAPDQLSAAELATMFHLYFLGSSEGLVFDVPREPFPHALWNPLAAHLAELGVRVCLGEPVESLASGKTRRFRVRHGGCGSDVDGVVLATDITGLREIVARSPILGPGPWRRSIEALHLAPPFLVRRLWLDKPVRPDRPAFLGAGSLPPLDNISVLDRFESEAARWALTRGGSVVELHAYAITDSATDLPGRLIRRLHELYPETREARIVGDLSEWRQDCPLFGPGDFARRPTVVTPHDGLVLAGDGIRIDLPVALMERAAATGWHAANRLLSGWGLAGHPVRSVPNRGRLAAFRLLARHLTDRA